MIKKIIELDGVIDTTCSLLKPKYRYVKTAVCMLEYKNRLDCNMHDLTQHVLNPVNN